MSAWDAKPSVQLIDVEDRVLAFHGWRSTKRHDFLLRALGLTKEEYRAAEDRLLEVGFVAPAGRVSRQ